MDRFNGAEAACAKPQSTMGPALVDVIAQSLEEVTAPVLQWMG
jgi:hypothetical protein